MSADEELEAFSAGGKTLSSGVLHLYDVIRLDDALPATIGKLDGSPFALNVVAVALWRGAVIAAYLMLVAEGRCRTQTTAPVSKSDGAYRTSAVTGPLMSHPSGRPARSGNPETRRKGRLGLPDCSPEGTPAAIERK